jgi:hypothetical protein
MATKLATKRVSPTLTTHVTFLPPLLTHSVPKIASSSCRKNIKPCRNRHHRLFLRGSRRRISWIVRFCVPITRRLHHLRCVGSRMICLIWKRREEEDKELTFPYFHVYWLIEHRAFHHRMSPPTPPLHELPSHTLHTLNPSLLPFFSSSFFDLWTRTERTTR